MRERSFGIEIFLVSLAAILLEISLTRIFSFKLYYYFTYLILGLALLGLGAGGVFVALSERLRRVAPKDLVARCCLLAGLAVPASYAVVLRVQFNIAALGAGPGEVMRLTAICLALFVPFLFVGVALATIFGARPDRIDRLYCADLIGAGLGCALAVPLFVSVTPPGTVFLAGFLLAATALIAAVGARSRWSWPAGLLAALLLLVGLFPERLPDPIPDRNKTMSPQNLGSGRVLFSRWSSVFRVDVLEGPEPEQRLLLSHDGNLGSSVQRFDGDLASLDRFDTDARSAPFRLLPPEPRVLIIGAAGGHEILASLYFGAGEITAVEFNPVTVSLLTDHFADYSGRIAEHDRVTLVNAEGRSFLRRDRREYDLIWLVAPDSYSALNAASSGAFVLSESYLYTVEMILESLDHLSPRGILCAQFGELLFAAKPNRTARYLATAREAFRRRGIGAFPERVLLSTVPEFAFLDVATVLLSPRAFDPEQVRRFHANNAQIKGALVWHPIAASDARATAAMSPLERLASDPLPRHPVRKVITLPQESLSRWYDGYAYVVTPVTDDSPFFWHFTRFRDALLKPWGGVSRVGPIEFWDPEGATGERTLLVLLGVAMFLAAVFLLLPLAFARGTWSRIPYKGHAALYFAALGLGFLFFEVCLIQKLTLFLGYPTYSLTVTLFGLLVFAGIGSLLSGRYAQRRNRALAGLLTAVVLLALFYQLGLPHVVNRFVGASLWLRVSLAVLLLAPLGLCLGAFMPIGLKTLASLTVHQREYVAWGWAVNGFFSVTSSVLATILSMTFGFGFVLLLAAIVYAIGVLALWRVPQPPAQA